MEKITSIKPDVFETAPIWFCVLSGIVGGLLLGVVLILILR